MSFLYTGHVGSPDFQTLLRAYNTSMTPAEAFYAKGLIKDERWMEAEVPYSFEFMCAIARNEQGILSSVKELQGKLRRDQKIEGFAEWPPVDPSWRGDELLWLTLVTTTANAVLEFPDGRAIETEFRTLAEHAITARMLRSYAEELNPADVNTAYRLFAPKGLWLAMRGSNIRVLVGTYHRDFFAGVRLRSPT